MTTIDRILVVEDDLEMSHLLEDELGAAGFDVTSAPDGAQAMTELKAGEYDAVVTDLVMPNVRGDELLSRIREWNPNLPVLIMTAFGSIESAVESMRGGAYYYLAKPFEIEELVGTLRAALQEERLRRIVAEPNAATPPTNFVGESTTMKRLLTLLGRAAAADSPVLIRGESGTGKELLARAVHDQSPRHDKAFVAVNCSAIPDALLESQLFGHRKGAFTDAREDRPGMFRVAEQGTLFLDEIGDMPIALQAKILRVLQEGEIQPVGATAPEKVDVRIVAATHRDLEELCAAGRFRQDLYYRLNVISLDVPPLRSRPDDLMPLIAHFLDKHGRRLGREGTTVSSEALELLRAYAWPGNVRELENVIQRALVLGQGPRVGPEDLPETLKRRAPNATTEDLRSLSEVEREQIIRVLRSVRGNKAAAARLLGLDRKTLYRKLDLYGLDVD